MSSIWRTGSELVWALIDDTTKPSTKEITIFCWKFYGPHAVGHISMRLSDGTYISHWPNKALKSIFKKPAAQMTYEEDVKLESRPPDQVISFPASNLNEKKIKWWWCILRNKNIEYNLINKNCAHVISEAILAGIESQFHKDYKEIGLKNGNFKMPTITQKEIADLFEDWPKESYLKLSYQAYLENSLRELLNVPGRFLVEMLATQNVSTGDLFSTSPRLKNLIKALGEFFQNFTQDLSADLEEIYKGQDKTPKNDLNSLNVDIQTTLNDMLKRIAIVDMMENRKDAGMKINSIYQEYVSFRNNIPRKFDGITFNSRAKVNIRSDQKFFFNIF